MPTPVCHLHKYNCHHCRHGFETTEEYDASCECDECGKEAELIESIPLYAEEPAAVACLRKIVGHCGFRGWCMNGKEHTRPMLDRADSVLAAYDAGKAVAGE